jgi:hypothetical protein
MEDGVEEEDIEEVASERTGDPAALVVELAMAEELPVDEAAILEVAILEAGADDEVVL